MTEFLIAATSALAKALVSAMSTAPAALTVTVPNLGLSTAPSLGLSALGFHAILIGVGIVLIGGFIGFIIHKLHNAGVFMLLSALAGGIKSGEIDMRNDERTDLDTARQRSLNGMDKILAPLIAKDFPSFNLDEMKTLANTVLTETLDCLETRRPRDLQYCDIQYLGKMRSQIEDLNGSGSTVRYDNIDLHKTVVSEYKKTPGLCRITFQTAFRADFFRADATGRILEGSKGKSTEFRATMVMIYILDVSKCDSAYQTVLTANCPNCGAPIGDPSRGTCEYCGSPIDLVNARTWRFNTYDII